MERCITWDDGFQPGRSGPPRGHWAGSGDIWAPNSGRGASGTWCIESGDTGQQPPMHRLVPRTKGDPSRRRTEPHSGDRSCIQAWERVWVSPFQGILGMDSSCPCGFRSLGGGGEGDLDGPLGPLSSVTAPCHQAADRHIPILLPFPPARVCCPGFPRNVRGFPSAVDPVQTIRQ